MRGVRGRDIWGIAVVSLLCALAHYQFSCFPEGSCTGLFSFSEQSTFFDNSILFAWQNRVLGPGYLLITSSLGVPNAFASTALVVVLLVLQYCLMFFLLKTKLTDFKAWAWTGLFIGLHFFYPFGAIWDIIDNILFTLIAYGIIQDKRKSYFIGLFFVGVLNRESALFVPLYLFFRSFFITEDKKVECDKGLLLLSLKLFFIGFIIILSLRYGLFYLTGEKADTEAMTMSIAGSHWGLLYNLKMFIHFIEEAQIWCPLKVNHSSFGDITLSEVVISFFSVLGCTRATFQPIVVFLMMLISIIFLLIGRCNQKYTSLVCLCMLSAVFMFGNFPEARLYAYCYPFIIFMLAFHKKC